MTNEEETNLENEAIFILDRMNVKELKELLKKHKAKDKGIAELRKQVEELEEIRQLLNGASLHPNITGVSVYDDVKDKIAEQAGEIEELKKEVELFNRGGHPLENSFDAIRQNQKAEIESLKAENERLRKIENAVLGLSHPNVKLYKELAEKQAVIIDRLKNQLKSIGMEK